ncbi:MAG: thermonuclease family protein [Deltaproteobacteria bacterium]|nr:MAG: thermonuclease family protein [Deltaproteobacteria bacterium]
MKKIIPFLILLSLFALGSLLQTPTSVFAQNREGPFRVKKVIDGDTVVFNNGRHLRYLGINTPERGEPFWRKARDYNARMVKGRMVELEFGNITEDKYGRILAYLYVKEKMANAQLLKVGWAHLFVLAPIKYYRDFFGLQEEARTKGMGIWGKRGFKGGLKITRLNANAEGDDRYNLNGEYVRICNISPRSINIKGFSLSDRGGKQYTFPWAVLRPGYTLLLFTGEGRNMVEGEDQLRLYWGARYPIWNNKGDTAYLRNPEGRLIDSLVYKRRRK